jgi:hypothetical protein
MTNKAIRYVAELSHVREVSLLGTTDLTFWRDRLRSEDLIPTEQDGCAQLLIVAAHSKFMGVRFTEVSFSVLVSQAEQGSGRDGAFLVQAFNSSRLFAFCERAFFATPYYHGDCRLSTTSRVSIQIIKGGEVVSARDADREDLRWGQTVGLARLSPSGRNKFFARNIGHTQKYPFLAAEDTVSIKPAPGAEVLQALIDSHFVGKEWAVREDADHAKSKTYRRSETLSPDGG